MNKFDLNDKFLKDCIKDVSEEHLEKYLVFRVIVNNPNDVVRCYKPLVDLLNDDSMNLKEKIKKIENVYLAYFQCVGICYDKEEAENLIEKISSMYDKMTDVNEEKEKVVPTFIISRFDQLVPIRLIAKDGLTKHDKDQFENSKKFTEMIDKVDDEEIAERVRLQNKMLIDKINYKKGTVDEYFALNKRKQAMEANVNLQRRLIKEQDNEIERITKQIEKLVKEKPQILEEKDNLLNV